MAGTPGVQSTLNAYEGSSMGTDLGTGPDIAANAAGGPAKEGIVPSGIDGTVEDALLAAQGAGEKAAEGVSKGTLMIAEGLATMIATNPFAPEVDLSPPGESD